MLFLLNFTEGNAAPITAYRGNEDRKKEARKEDVINPALHFPWKIDVTK